MKGIFPALSIISVLYSAVSSLNCTSCGAFNAPYNLDTINIPVLIKDHCEGDELPCSSEEDVCASINISMTSHDGLHESYFRRTCWNRQYCNRSESISTVGSNLSYSVTCCTTDGCKPDPPALEAENITKNGVLCPACFSYNVPCKANYSIQCTGEEKYCLSLHRKHTQGFQYHTSGCATENVCKEDRSLDFLLNPNTKDIAYCTKVTSKTNLPAKNFLWCHICHECQSSDSRFLPVLCPPDDDVCVFEKIKNAYDKVLITKRCGKSSECSRAGTIRSSIRTILINTSCCNHNRCHIPFPTLPSISNDVNGLICPSCFYHSSDRCLGYSKLKCTGNEKRCIHYMRTDIQDDSITWENLRGCTTDGICKAGSGLVQTERTTIPKRIQTDIHCTGNSAATRRITIFSFLMITFTALCVLDS